MPFISCLVSKVATEWPYLLFYPPFSGLIPPNVLVSASCFVHPQTVLYLFSGAIIGQQASCLTHVLHLYEKMTEEFICRSFSLV